ncbi:hypothetical protein M378DRAFT_18994, partial [Amanita muscaria Koide BX008]
MSLGSTASPGGCPWNVVEKYNVRRRGVKSRSQTSSSSEMSTSPTKDPMVTKIQSATLRYICSGMMFNQWSTVPLWAVEEDEEEGVTLEEEEEGVK